ncbi:ABC transporter substrate-binding protein [Vibrio lentus]|nr:ABC transporter substrate-binding protein [Vibrio lentus]
MLKERLQWSNGEPVTASDFVFGWQRAVSPKTGNNTGFVFSTANIVNASEILGGDKDPSELGIKALDEHTRLKLRFQKAYALLHEFNEHQNLLPLYPLSWLKRKATSGLAQRTLQPTALYLSKWVPNEYVEVTRNPNYWDNASTVNNKVTYLGLSSSKC